MSLILCHVDLGLGCSEDVEASCEAVDCGEALDVILFALTAVFLEVTVLPCTLSLLAFANPLDT